MIRTHTLPICPARATLTLLAVTLLIAASGCRKPPPRPTQPPTRPQVRASTDDLAYLKAEALGAGITLPPWIAHVNAIDLDQDGLLDVVACESQENKIIWIRQVAQGRFEEITVAENLLAPVHVEAADMDVDGDLDLLISIMGYVFPNNDKIGSVVILENDGSQSFTARHIVDNTYRVVDIRAADLNGDGQLDLAVGQFGYDQGQIMWMERTGPWTFREHVLLELSGTINVCIDDFNGDAKPDIVALVSQQWEEIYYFQNNGSGVFTSKRIWGSTNEDYGSSGISIADLNGDGRTDVLYTNGDSFGPAAQPGPRPWHGVQWLENTGHGNFRYHRVADLPGAYSPIGVDLDRDGSMDIVAVAAYCTWDRTNKKVASLAWFQNDGNMRFTRRILAHRPKDLLTIVAGDFDNTGQPVLVTGGFYPNPPFEDMSRILLWRRSQP